MALSQKCRGSISCSGGGRVVFLLSLESPLIHHCLLLCSLFVLPRCSRCSLAVWHPAWPARTPGIRSRLMCSDCVRWAQQTQSARDDKQGSGLPPQRQRWRINPLPRPIYSFPTGSFRKIERTSGVFSLLYGGMQWSGDTLVQEQNT